MKKNAFLTTIRTVISMIIPLITFPYVARVLSVDEIGRYNFSNSVVSYFLLVAGLGISTYAIREGAKIRDCQEKINKFSSEMYFINFISTIVSYIAMAISLIVVPKFTGYRTLILILSVSIFLNCFGRQWIFNIYEDFTTITVLQIVFQIISIIFLFLFVRSEGDVNIYAFVCLFSSSGPFVLYGILSKKYVSVKLKYVHLKNLIKHIKPISIIFGMAIASTIYINSDITIIGFLKTDYEVGIYSTAVKIYNIVKQVLVAVITVTIPRLTLYAGTEKYERLFKKVFDSLVTITIPAVVGLFMLSKEAIQIVAGNQYIAATGELKILCIAIVCALFANLFGTCVLLPYDKEIIFLNATIASAVINIGLNFLLIPKWGGMAAAFTTALSQAIVLIIHYYYSKDFVDIWQSIRCIVNSCLGASVIILICLIVDNFIHSLYLKVMISIFVSMVGYIIIEILLKNYVVKELIISVKNKITFGRY